MTITAQTSAQIKNAVSKIFKTNKRDLQTDTSDEGVAVLAAINTFLELSAPSFSDLITLREAIYTYQDQDSLGIRLYKASSDVQGVVKSLIAEKQFGYTELNENLAYEGSRGVPYADILASIKANVADVSDEGSYRDLAVAIATGVGAANDSDLIDLLEFENVFLERSISGIKTRMNSVVGEDAPNIVRTIVRDSFLARIYPANIKGFRLLSIAIKDYSINNHESYDVIRENIKAAVAFLNGEFGYHEIVMAIVGAIGASANLELINAMELEFYQALEYDRKTWTDRGHQPSQIQALMVGITGSDAISIVHSIFIDQLAMLWWSVAENISAVSGAVSLSLAIRNYYTNNIVTYGDILDLIKARVAELNGSFSKYDIALAIASAIGASENEDLINELELDFYVVSSDPNTIQSEIANISGDDGPSMVVSLYSHVLDWRAPPSSAVKWVRELSMAIKNYHIDHNIMYQDIVDNIKTSVLAVQEPFTLRDLAVAFLSPIDLSENLMMIDLLEVELSRNPNSAKAALSDISGVDGPSIISSLFIGKFARTSYSMGDLFYSLDSAIEDYHNLDASVVTISSALGSAALTTGNNTIIGGINELDSEIDVIKSTLTITPKTGAYLNKCTMDNEGVYTVGGSVFIGFDPEGDGILLSSMDGLNTLTGYINAMAQCATWQLTYENQDLYVTTTHAGGTTGTAEDTGCSPALDFASAGAYCLSVFDNYDYA